jgi:hypothetical protein
MTSRDFTTTVLVNRSPKEAFDAINRPRDWWGRDIEGRTDRADEEWTYRYKDMHFSRQRTAELVPDRKVVWHVLEARMNFLQDKTEWEDTKMIFDISRKGDKTEIRFTHAGLVPEVECFDICKSAWTGLIADSLQNLIETGEGLPDTVE